jgi:ATP-grasp ribosomal peptide maturase
VTVIILARRFDPTADAVVTALGERDVPVFRFDVADFPRVLRMNAEFRAGRWAGRLWNDHHAIEIESIRSIWYRNPSTYQLPGDLSDEEAAFCHREAKLGFGGVLASLNVLLANPPSNRAIFKPYQWRIAAECGLTLADTVITNDPATARSFVADRSGDVVTKALGPSGFVEDGAVKVAYTRRLTAADRANLDSVAVTATTLQASVPKAYEVRLTVIGNTWFPIAVHAGTEATRQDWRSDPRALTYVTVTVPDAVADSVRRYMARMDLAYTAMDFVVTPDREWVMLEANTGPQFAWLEAATGAPMVSAMADMLAKGST